MKTLTRLVLLILLLSLAACGGGDEEDLNAGVEPPGETFEDEPVATIENMVVTLEPGGADEAGDLGSGDTLGADGDDIFGQSAGATGADGELFAPESGEGFGGG